MTMVVATEVLRKVTDHLLCMPNDVLHSDFQMYKENPREKLWKTL